MGGDDSQKLLPWSGIALRFGEQQTSVFGRINTITETCGGHPANAFSGQPNSVLRRLFYVFDHQRLDWNFPQL